KERPSCLRAAYRHGLGIQSVESAQFPLRWSLTEELLRAFAKITKRALFGSGILFGTCFAECGKRRDLDLDWGHQFKPQLEFRPELGVSGGTIECEHNRFGFCRHNKCRNFGQPAKQRHRKPVLTK